MVPNFSTAWTTARPRPSLNGADVFSRNSPAARRRLSPFGSRSKLLLLRGAVGASALVCFYSAVAHLPLAEATVIHQTAPLFTAVFAAWFLRERLTARVVWSLLVAFVGVVLIARPDWLFGRPGALPAANDANGANARQITFKKGASFAPFFTPDDKSLIYASNWENPRSRNFDVYLVSVKGGEPVPVTRDSDFDGFPMFSPNGKWLVFCSNRGGKVPGETNIFLAEWRP